MNRRIDEHSSESSGTSTRNSTVSNAPAADISHPVLSRLLEEVRNEKRVDAAYDRVHHRHNRGR